MAIVGGAVCPPLMGFIADYSNMASGFMIPLVCFAAVFLFSVSLRKQHP
jgi:FHS family L-fucose permease-like MFS transporter